MDVYIHMQHTCKPSCMIGYMYGCIHTYMPNTDKQFNLFTYKHAYTHYTHI